VCGADGRPATVVAVADDGTEVVLARVPPGPPDLGLVEALARLAMAARRAGFSPRVRDASPELARLVELVGLAGALGLEARREPELREQLGGDEVMEAGDAVSPDLDEHDRPRRPDRVARPVVDGDGGRAVGRGHQQP
jgi:hypothetical protein